MENTHIELTPKLLSALYTEAMLLADEARSYFDRDPTDTGMTTTTAVAFSCESLKVTTRLMHSIAWLLAQKALRAGEITDEEARSEARQLGYAPASDDLVLPTFPIEAQIIIRSSEDLYYRLQRMGNGLAREAAEMPAPLRMLEELRSAF
jgi:regulator of CtrA degradation